MNCVGLDVHISRGGLVTAAAGVARNIAAPPVPLLQEPHPVTRGGSPARGPVVDKNPMADRQNEDPSLWRRLQAVTLVLCVAVVVAYVFAAVNQCSGASSINQFPTCKGRLTGLLRLSWRSRMRIVMSNWSRKNVGSAGNLKER